MEKKMNLVSMVFLFFCVVGFDHFYKSVMAVPEQSHPLGAKEELAPLVPPTIQSPKLAKLYRKIQLH